MWFLCSCSRLKTSLLCKGPVLLLEEVKMRSIIAAARPRFRCCTTELWVGANRAVHLSWSLQHIDTLTDFGRATALINSLELWAQTHIVVVCPVTIGKLVPVPACVEMPHSETKQPFEKALFFSQHENCFNQFCSSKIFWRFWVIQVMLR